ncbi:BlaI/MecI/CopY family transcriptional regulator [Candidatus Merdisoma sp. JLR.KK006]|uniref:BlaI/MecI/CopY family transcriptional regulator n=1 Tax=Candidatus Merdisoma sp. JLR.KK006 TaxID=3112626 RepID=UPI002FF30124
MAEIQLGVIEAQFADMIWEREPVTSSELVKLAAEAFTWKRTTTHTVLKRLCEKGLFENNKGTVTSLISRSQFYSIQSRRFVEDTFEGSLPAFIAAFTKNSRLTSEEADKIRKMIDEAESAELE